ncbi:hypothetical protein [Bifidobacterium xylocopae]|uniref:hypothetical protein n=1 Tax=Bifidobacterium xylocopae TaxID=2493119 RepID=UPI000FDF06F4|nr:hypothetical protein [Bifidobacterium xylocopae]
MVRAEVGEHLAAGIPNPPATQPPSTGGITSVMGWVKWGAAIFAAILLIAAFITWARSAGNGDDRDGLSKISMVLFAAVGVSAAFSLVAFLVDQ